MSACQTSRCVVGWALVIGLWLATGGTVCAQEPPLISGLRVEGNQYISADAVIGRATEILKIGEVYTEEKAIATREAILKMGYFDEVAISYETTEAGVEVIITVLETQRIEEIVFAGNTVFDDNALQQIILTKIGHPVDREIIRRDVRRIQDHYTKEGYFAVVAEAGVDFGVLTFVINEARIEDILIEGLKKTKEWVVRRQIHTRPGALYREQDLLKDVERIFNLGLFELGERVIDLRPGVKEPTQGVIPVIQLAEKPTGLASIAAAYSDLDDFVLMLSVSENNLQGRARRASVNLEMFGRTSYDISLFEPYLDAKDTSLDVSVFDTERRRRFAGGAAIALPDEEFRERRTGAVIKVARPTSVSERVSVGLRSEKISSSFFQSTRSLGPAVTLFSAGALTPQQSSDFLGGGPDQGPDNPNLQPDKPGPGDLLGPIVVAAPLHPGGTVNSVTLGWTKDTRDIIARPSRGAYMGVTGEFAGGLVGGEQTFQLYQLDRRRYFPLRNKRDVVAVRLLLGLSTGDVPLFDSFSVGGARTLRGYEEDRFRGAKMLLVNAEYRYRLSDSLTVVGFADAGDAFGGAYPTVVPGFSIQAEDQNFDLHVGVGVGLRAETPLGPLRLDFGFGEDGSEVHFGFGHTY